MSAYTDAVAALPGLLGHWNMATSSCVIYAGSLGNMTAGGSPGTFGQGSLLPGDPTQLSVGDKTSTTSDFCFRADTAALDLTTGLTLGTWIKPASVLVQMSILTKAGAYSLVTATSHFQLSLDIGGNQMMDTQGHLAVPDNVFFVVGTYDGTTKRIYVNGAIFDEGAQTGSMTNSTAPLRFGAMDLTGSPVAGFVGAGQHPFICNQATSQANIQNLYQIGAATAAEAAGDSIQAMPWTRQALAADANRRWAILSNGSDTDVWVTKGATAMVGGGILLPANGGRVRIADYTGIISVISDSYVGGKTVGLETG